MNFHLAKNNNKNTKEERTKKKKKKLIKVQRHASFLSEGPLGKVYYVIVEWSGWLSHSIKYWRSVMHTHFGKSILELNYCMGKENKVWQGDAFCEVVFMYHLYNYMIILGSPWIHSLFSLYLFLFWLERRAKAQYKH